MKDLFKMQIVKHHTNNYFNIPPIIPNMGWCNFMSDKSFSYKISLPNHIYNVIKPKRNYVDRTKGWDGTKYNQCFLLQKWRGCVWGGSKQNLHFGSINKCLKLSKTSRTSKWCHFWASICNGDRYISKQCVIKNTQYSFAVAL